MRLALIGAGRHGQRYLKAENGLVGPTYELDRHRSDTVLSKRLERPGVAGATIESICANDEDTAELLREPTVVDGVIIATRPDSHAALAIKCMRAGLHVLVEKPAALTFADVQAMTDCAEREKRTLMVAHTHLFSANFRQPEPAALERFTITVGGPRPTDAMQSVPALVDWGSHAVAMAMALCWGQPRPSIGRRSEPHSYADSPLAVFPVDGEKWRASKRAGYLLSLVGHGCSVTVECGDFHQRALEVSANNYLGDGRPQTPICNMVRAFTAACAGDTDFRASSEFTRAVYRTVLA